MLTESAVLVSLVELAEQRRGFGLARASVRSHVRAVSVTLIGLAVCKRVLVATYGDIPASVYEEWALEAHDGKLISDVLTEAASMMSILESAERRIVALGAERERLLVLHMLKMLARVECELDALGHVIDVPSEPSTNAELGAD